MNSRKHHPANYVSAAVRIVIAGMAYLVVIGAIVMGGGVALLTFTVQSNLMVAVSFTWTAWALITDRRTPPEWLAASSIFYISITGIIFNSLVSPGSFRSGDIIWLGFTASDFAHVVIPILAVAVWVIFEEHRRIPWRYGMVWLTYVVMYITVIALAVSISTSLAVPYEFLDVEAQGWSSVLTTIGMLLASFVLLAYALIAADRILPERTPISEHDRFYDYYINPVTTEEPLTHSAAD